MRESRNICKFKAESIIILTTLFILLTITPVFAGVSDILNNIKDSINAQVIAWILTALLSMTIIVKYTEWVSHILITLGGLFISIGFAINDSKISKEELADIKVKWSEFRKAFENRGKV